MLPFPRDWAESLVAVRCWTIAVLLGLSGLSSPTEAQTIAGLKVPDGFEATLFADDDLAHDVYCMTLDSLGRVAVAGQGYVKLLIDTNGDGKADTVKQFADGPQNGAQGMYFLGRDLLCVGDAGLIRYRDQNADDKADGPPDVFLKMKTGNEHHAHSVQKGPDGWWYLIAGNDAGIDKRYVSLKSSPVKEPEAGVFFRLKPDLSGAEVITHGLRNAYDFAFNASGDAFTFDSDDEREVSLPWFRPTRVFHMLPGSHAGWVTRNWKQPDYFADMPPVVADFGRGSPTGVVSYRHTQFPKPYRDSLFVLDWTYGRVLNVKLSRDISSYAGETETFVSGTGGFGFAPTDIEVGPDGSLYVSVGGRGTRGGVYRISAKKAQATKWPADIASAKGKLAACLTAPQPLCSWSRKIWEPLAKDVGQQSFVEAAMSEDRPIGERVRAIEIVTELFGGLTTESVAKLQTDGASEVRARALWSLQRTQSPTEHVGLIAKFLADDDASVGRIAAETLASVPTLDSDPVIDALAKRIKCPSPYDRMAAARLIPLLTTEGFKKLSIQASKSGYLAGLTNAYGYLGRKPGVSGYAFKIGQLVLDKSNAIDMKLDAVRLMQLGLGDLAPVGKVPAAFEGYAPRYDLSAQERELDPYRISLAEKFPSGNERLDLELSRLLAMLQPFNPDLLNKVLAKITDKSHPTDDLHYLLVAARIPSVREAVHTEQIAKALVDIEPKLKARKLTQDSNWEPRFGEIYKALTDQDPDLPIVMSKRPNFGAAGHVLFMSQLPGEHVAAAVVAFAKQIAADKNYQWSNDVVFLIGESKLPEHRELLRKQSDNFGVRGALLQVLAETPAVGDRALFVEGLESSQIEAVTACIGALSKLRGVPDGKELVALLQCARRLGADKNEFAAREAAIALLELRTKEKFAFVTGEAGHKPQSEAIGQWTDWMTKNFPEEMAKVSAADGNELPGLKDLLAKVDWSKGDADRGRKLYETRSCVQCHGGRKALGPDLAGAAGRFSREDLFIAIVLPNRDVSPRYQTTMIETKDGKVRTGMIIYEATDGVLMRNSTNQTFRIETVDVEHRRRMSQSLMPSGLLKGLKPSDLADLYAFMKTADAK